MSQYSAHGHRVTSWHLQHYATRALGVGLAIVEATAVSPRGLVTPYDLGLWTDEQQVGLAELASSIAGHGAVPAIQLSHGGRKASRSRPWDGDVSLRPRHGGWPVTGPSPLPFAAGYPTPEPATSDDIGRIVEEFAGAARRALLAGYQMVELHAGHGRLLHSFLSPLANRRLDAYGGAPAGRCRLLLETVKAVRAAWPEELPLAVRLSCEDDEPGGWTLDDTLALTPALRAAGVDLIDCSSGGIRRPQHRTVYPGYQVRYAAAVRSRGHVATAAVGLITSLSQAEAILAEGRADMVLMGRALLLDPLLPLRAAHPAAFRLIPPPYRRAFTAPAGCEAPPEL
jgi:2,4-dienoyl-CoA reductase-like NADH-dependent reductase (Old Yellow Enzyme family)